MSTDALPTESASDTAAGFALWAEANLTTFSRAIADQLEHSTGSEQDHILRLAFAALRARQELRGALR